MKKVFILIFLLLVACFSCTDYKEKEEKYIDYYKFYFSEMGTNTIIPQEFDRVTIELEKNNINTYDFVSQNNRDSMDIYPVLTTKHHFLTIHFTILSKKNGLEDIMQGNFNSAIQQKNIKKEKIIFLGSETDFYWYVAKWNDNFLLYQAHLYGVKDSAVISYTYGAIVPKSRVLEHYVKSKKVIQLYE